MITNYSSFVAFLISIVCLTIYAFFLAPKQFVEVFRPKDWLSGLRWIILSILIISIFTSIPGIVYQGYRSVGQEYEFMRALSTVLSQVSKLGTTILLVLVFTYKKKQ